MYRQAQKNFILSKFTDMQREYLKSPFYTNGYVNPQKIDNASLACTVINECKAVIEQHL